MGSWEKVDSIVHAQPFSHPRATSTYVWFRINTYLHDHTVLTNHILFQSLISLQIQAPINGRICLHPTGNLTIAWHPTAIKLEKLEATRVLDYSCKLNIKLEPAVTSNQQDSNDNGAVRWSMWQLGYSYNGWWIWHRTVVSDMGCGNKLHFEKRQFLVFPAMSFPSKIKLQWYRTTRKLSKSSLWGRLKKTGSLLGYCVQLSTPS